MKDIRQKLIDEFTYVGDEKISGNTALKLILNILDNNEDKPKEETLKL